MIDNAERIHDIDAAATRLRQWCMNEALPLWAERGRNARGGFYERLFHDGTPDIGADIRIRVEARQTYVYAHATRLGWYDGLAIADAGRAFMLEHCMVGGPWDGNSAYPGLAYILSPGRGIVDERIDLYTQAFFLLSMAWHYRASGAESSLDIARRACAFLDRAMASEHGGWIESLPDALPRRQNPHMHLFEAFLALFQASRDPAFLTLADRVFALFEKHFLNSQNGVFLEFFTPDWKPAGDGGDLIEPGHMMEWCWLLSVYATLKDIDLSAPIRMLYEGAMDRGLNPGTGLLWDEVRISGDVTKPSHRSWSLTEFLKASIALARLGDRVAADRIPLLTERLFSTYLDTDIAGGWHDCRDAEGALIPSPMQASTFYHYMCACAELDRFAASLRASS